MRMPILIRTLVVVSCWIAVVAAPRPAAAQLTAADSAAVLLAAAEGFRNRGEIETSEVLYGLIVESFPGTSSAEAAQARLDIAMGPSQGGGEVELKVWSTLYGLWQGAMIPAALGFEGPEPYGLGVLVGGPAGFLLGHHMGRSRSYSLGQARAITWGGTWGAIQGLGWAHVLNLGGDEYDPDEEAVLQSMIVGGALGIAGGLVAARREIAPGTSTSAMLGSLWGMFLGSAAIALVDPDADDDEIVATIMLTGNAGLGVGALLGSRVPLSRNRARLISLGGIVVGFAGIGGMMIALPDDPPPRLVAGVMLGASLAGFVIGTSLTREDRGEDDASNDVEAAASLTAPGALLNWSRGDWELSTPLPSPVRQPSARRGGRDGLAWKVPLLSVRF